MELKALSKTIEVIDSRTGNTCKVACMSCIRGHRTTSCGKSVCRSKVFWTVKRPGRPASACTCPLGITGRCQCVIATSACPHRSKKGEGRSVDCRCDEQGRWCCVLEADDWNALHRRENPRVDFYSNPEAMNAARATTATTSFPSTPSHSAGTPQTLSSVPTTPEPLSRAQSTNVDMPSLNEYQPPLYQAPRFGLMGVGAPLGNDGYVGQDMLQWQGQAPQAPREIQPYSQFIPPNPGATPNIAPMGAGTPTQFTYTGTMNGQHYPNFDFTPVTQGLQNMHMQPQQPPPPQNPIHRDKLMEDYYHYQFPGAICQNCGLSGCNCRSCPPVMQSSIDGSWAQCCSRKHVRTAELAQRGIPSSSVALEHQDILRFQAMGSPHVVGNGQTAGVTGLRPGGDQPFAPTFAVDDLGMTNFTEQMDFSQFVVTDPELPSHGCCCGGET